MKTLKSMAMGAVVAIMAAVPQAGMCQKENPRGIYKLTSVKTSKATVTDCMDQYKVCTDSITLNVYIDNARKMFRFSRNTIFNYTGDTPANPEDKSDLIFDSNKNKFSLKWWTREDPDRQKQFPYFVPNEWCTEKYKSGVFSDDGKIVFDALTKLQKADKKNRIIGTWRNIGVAYSLDKAEIEALKKGYPNSTLYNKRFYVFTPTHWVLTMDAEGFIMGQYNTINYINDDSFTDNVSIVPTKALWISDDCACLSVKNLEKYIVLERVTDDVPVLERIAFWYVPRDFDWHVKQADAGNHVIQFQLGGAYITGNGVIQDEKKGVDYIIKSAEGGYVPAQHTLGEFYYRGQFVEQNTQKAYSWFRKGAEAGFAPSQNGVAWMLYKGEGVDQDLLQAVEWAQKAVAQGEANSFNTLAEMYYNGAGVAQDKARAFDLYSKGAELNDAECMQMLATMYANGDGVKKDEKMAAYWQKKLEERQNR